MQKLTGSQNFARSVRLFKESLNPNASDDSYLSLVPNYTELGEAHAKEYVDGKRGSNHFSMPHFY